MASDFFFDDWNIGSDYSSDWTFDSLPVSDYGSMLPAAFQFDDWNFGSNYDSLSNVPGWTLNTLSPEYYGMDLGPAQGFGTGAADLRALLPNSWADALNSPTGKALMSYAPLAAGIAGYFQQKPLYKSAEEKLKRDMEWEEEQRKRQRLKQASLDKYSAPDPAATAAINRIAGNRGTYSGFATPTNYGRVGGTAPRRMFMAEGGSLPGGYKTGPLNFMRYLLNSKRFPWEGDPRQDPTLQPAPTPAVERLEEYGSGARRRRQLDELEERAVQGRAKGGALQRLKQGTHLRGATKGQDDVIPVAASAGEYVFDADAVSALGDGNNEAGAAALDRMRMNLRKHKRAAPASKIPPKARAPEAYLKKGK